MASSFEEALQQQGVMLDGQAQQGAQVEEPVPTADALTSPQESMSFDQALEQQGIKVDRAEAVVAETMDPALGEVRPRNSNGSSPDTPINRSPIGFADRFKLGFGNEKGKLNFLKENYEGAQKTKDGNFVVQKDGLWYRVDPDGLGDGDAWSRSVELAKDMTADIGDVVTSVGAIEGGQWAGAAAGAKAGAAIGSVVPGAGTLAGSAIGAVGGFAAGTAGGAAAANYLNTSMGKLVGTYDATPEQQAQEASFETMLALGGAAIPFAAKPTAGLIAKQLGKAGAKLGKASAAVKDTLVQAIGATSGAGADNVAHYLARPSQVSAALSRAAKGGVPSEKVIERLKDNMISKMGDLTKGTRAALSTYYEKTMKTITDQIPDSFQSVANKSARSVLEDFGSNGLGKFNKATGRFTLLPRQELLRIQQGRGTISEIASDPKSYKLAKQFIDEVNTWAGVKSLSGKSGFKQMVKADKAIRNAVQRFEQRARDVGSNETAMFFKQAKTTFINNFDEATTKQIAGSPLAKQYSTLKGGYEKISGEVAFLLDTNRKAIKGADSRQVYETALNKILTSTGRNQAAKTGTTRAIETLGEYNSVLRSSYTDVLDSNAAAAFTPRIRSNFVQFGLLGGSVGVAASGNVAGALPTAAIIAGTSPRLTKVGLGAAKKISTTTAKSYLAAKNFIQRAGGNQIDSLLQNDDALRVFFNSLSQMDEVKEQARPQIPMRQ